MPGYEVVDYEEKDAIEEIFTKSNGVIYRYYDDKERNQIYRVRDFENEISKKLYVQYSNGGELEPLMIMRKPPSMNSRRIL